MSENWQTIKSIAIVSELVQAETLSGEVYASELPGLSVAVTAAPGEKCERCWTRSTSVGQDAAHPAACERCVSVLRELRV
jgi:isoleucyl-tRNA synthetase